jgi:hypothetical protein
VLGALVRRHHIGAPCADVDLTAPGVESEENHLTADGERKIFF